MKALSVKQPWAWLICAGYKPIENRNWTIGRNERHGPYKSQHANFSLNWPCRIYVHAGKTMDTYSFAFLEKVAYKTKGDEWWDKFKDAYFVASLPLGAIIGEVSITGFLTSSPSPWFVGKYGFILEKPVLYDKPVPCTGQLGFFEVNI